MPENFVAFTNQVDALSPMRGSGVPSPLNDRTSNIIQNARKISHRDVVTYLVAGPSRA